MKERGFVPPPPVSSPPGAPGVVTSNVPVVGSQDDTREFWITSVLLRACTQMMPADPLLSRSQLTSPPLPPTRFSVAPSSIVRLTLSIQIFCPLSTSCRKLAGSVPLIVLAFAALRMSVNVNVSLQPTRCNTPSDVYWIRRVV